MKRLFKSAIRKFGYEISKTPSSQNARKTKRGESLSYYQTATGNYYLPTDAAQDEIARAIRNDLVFDEPIFNVIKRYAKPRSVVLDIGSNFGQMAILTSKLPDVEVRAFEADDFIFQILEKNIEANSANVVARFGAVHHQSGETLYFPVQDFERFQTYGSYGIDYVNGKGRPVPALTIDEQDFELPVSFMKVDVQGGDLFAMQGAVKTIEKYRMPIIFEYEWLFEEELNLSFQNYVDFVKSVGYKFEKVINGQNYLIVPKE